jgi:hypothetical protein
VLLHLNDAWVLMRLVVGRRLPGREVAGVSGPFKPIAIRLAAAPVADRARLWREFLAGRRAGDPVELAIDATDLERPGPVPFMFRCWFLSGLPNPVGVWADRLSRKASPRDATAVAEPAERSQPLGEPVAEASGPPGGGRRGRTGRREPEPSRTGENGEPSSPALRGTGDEAG